MDNGGPSVGALYAGAGPEGRPADTGMEMGRELYGAELAARTRYTDPLVGDLASAQPSGGMGTVGSGQTQAPEYYNYQPSLPVKYAVPSQAKERMAARQAIRQAAGGEEGTGLERGVIRTDPISDEEVSYLQAMKDQSELADFDRYVNSLVDPRKPGNLKWLMEIYPEFVNRRLSQVHTDYEYALRNQLIDSWGINTFDDLHFKYLVDQNKIKGPHLQTDLIDRAEGYSAGYLSPFQFKSIRMDGIRLPFASARMGRGAANENDWTMPDGAAALSVGRSDVALASTMYNDRSNPAAQQTLQQAGAMPIFGGNAMVSQDPPAPEQLNPATSGLANYSKLEIHVSTRCTREARVRGDDGSDGDGECMVPLLRRGCRSSSSSLLRRVPKRRVPRGRKHPPLLPSHPRPGRRVEQAFSSRSISSRNRCRPFLMSTVAEFLTEKMNNMARCLTNVRR